MKMLKKVGALAIAGAMAMSLGTISAFADETLSIGTITSALNGEYYDITVPYIASAGVAQVTMLAEICAADSSSFASTIAYETTAMIDQEAQDGSFAFKVAAARFSEETPSIQVKLGGTGISEAAVTSAPVRILPEAQNDPIVDEDVKGAVDPSITDALGLADAGVMRLDVSELISEGKLDLATTAVTIDGNPAYYTVYNGVTKLIALVDTTVATHTIGFASSVNGTQEVRYGNANLDELVSAGDISFIIGEVAVNKSAENMSDLAVLLSDVNGDGGISAGDISGVVGLVASNDTIPPIAATKGDAE